MSFNKAKLTKLEKDLKAYRKTLPEYQPLPDIKAYELRQSVDSLSSENRDLKWVVDELYLILEEQKAEIKKLKTKFKKK